MTEQEKSKPIMQYVYELEDKAREQGKLIKAYEATERREILAAIGRLVLPVGVVSLLTGVVIGYLLKVVIG